MKKPRVAFCAFLLVSLAFAALLAQDQTPTAVKDRLEEAVKGIAAFPPDTQTAVLEICQKPDLITQMAKTKTLPDLQGCSEAIQNAAKLLVQHPDIIETLNGNIVTATMVGHFYAKSPSEALALLKKGAAEAEKQNEASRDEAVKGISSFPAELQTPILEISQRPDLITQMAKTKALPDLQGCSEAIQNAAKALLQQPDVLETLNENIETVKMVGEFYAKSPAEALELVKKGEADEEKQKAAYMEEAVKGIAAYPPELQKPVLEICQRPELIAEIAKTKSLPELLQGYSDAIQAAAKVLVDHQDIIATLNENMETSKMVGEFYAKSPAEALALVQKGAQEAQTGTPTEQEEAVKGIASFPADTQKAILEICQKPDLVAEMAKTKALPDLQGCSEAVQDAAKTLLGHPDIVQTLSENVQTMKMVADFYAKSPTEALALVKKGAGEAAETEKSRRVEVIEGMASYPLETQKAILEICQKPELITKMAETKQLPDLQGYSDEIQKAAKELVQYPQVIQTLNEHLDTAKMVGELYAQSPSLVMEYLKNASEGVEKEKQQAKEKWIKMLQENPKALEELREALLAMQKEQAAKGAAETPEAAATAQAPVPDATVTGDDVTVYSAPSPQLVDYIVDNSDQYPAISSQVISFWGQWPVWNHWSPWYPWRPWPYPVYHPWWHGGPGPWYHPWYHPWWGWRHPWDAPWYRPWWSHGYHPGWGPLYHPWSHGPQPWHHPYGPWQHPYGPWHHPYGPLPHQGPGPLVPHAATHPWPHQGPGPLAPGHPWPHSSPIQPPEHWPMTPVQRPGEQPARALQPEHDLSQQRKTSGQAEGRQEKAGEERRTEREGRPVSVHSGEYEKHQRVAAAAHEHGQCWHGVSRGGGGRRR
jgi:hypothetical protein